MKNNNDILNTIIVLKEWKFWVGGAVYFSGIMAGSFASETTCHPTKELF